MDTSRSGVSESVLVLSEKLSTLLLVCRDLISDTDALDLCRPADADLGIPLVISGDGGGGGRGDRGEGEAGDEDGESRLEKSSVASEGDRTCVARIRGFVGRAPGVKPPPPSLGLEATPDPRLGAALSKAGVPAALDEPPFCSDCNDGVISMLPPPITVRLVSFPLSRLIACVSCWSPVELGTGRRTREPVS